MKVLSLSQMTNKIVKEVINKNTQKQIIVDNSLTMNDRTLKKKF